MAFRNPFLDPNAGNNLGLGGINPPMPTFPANPGIMPASSPIPIPTNPTNPPSTNPLAAFRNTPTPEMDAYQAYLRSQPQREDYQQNKLGKALSLIGGVAEGYNKGASAGWQYGKGLMDRPYEEAAEQWKYKGARLKELSDIEKAKRAEAMGLEVSIEETERKRAEQERAEVETLRKWLETQTDARFKGVQAENLRDQMRVRGLQLVDNEVTGNKELISLKDPNYRVDFGKFAQSIAEEQAEFDRREALKLKNAIKLDDRRTVNDRSINEHRAKLEKTQNPTQQNAAFEGAFKQILLENPDLQRQLYKYDDDGNLIAIDTGGDPALDALHTSLFRMVHRRRNEILGTNDDIGIDPKAGKGKGQDPYRQAAINQLRQAGIQETESAIEDATNQIREFERTGGKPQTPTVIPPPATTPGAQPWGPVKFGPIANPNATPFSQFGQPTPNIQPPGNRYQPFIDFYNSMQGIPSAIGGIPGNIYGNAPGTYEQYRLR